MQEIASVFAKTGTIPQAQRSVACHWKARDYYKLFEIVPSKSASAMAPVGQIRTFAAQRWPNRSCTIVLGARWEHATG